MTNEEINERMDLLESSFDYKTRLLEAKYQDLKADERRLMHTFCDILEQNKRLIDCEERVGVVYERLVELVHHESSIAVDIKKAKMCLAEFRSLIQDLNQR